MDINIDDNQCVKEFVEKSTPEIAKNSVTNYVNYMNEKFKNMSAENLSLKLQVGYLYDVIKESEKSSQEVERLDKEIKEMKARFNQEKNYIESLGSLESVLLTIDSLDKELLELKNQIKSLSIDLKTIEKSNDDFSKNFEKVCVDYVNYIDYLDQILNLIFKELDIEDTDSNSSNADKNSVNDRIKKFIIKFNSLNTLL